MSKAVANLTQLNETITFSAQDNGETINVKINELARGPAGADGPNSVTSATTSDGTANLSLSNVTTATATVTGTLTADHIHGNLAGSVYAHVRAGENLAKGDPVYISGSHGSGSTLIAIVSKADAGDPLKMPAVGVMDAAVTANANGHMVITGTISDINTATYSVNAELYVAEGGGFTATPPSAYAQPVARVERSNTNNGAVIVKVNGLSAISPTAGTLVRRDSSGVSDFNTINLGNLHTGGSPSAPYGSIGKNVLTGSSGVGISGNPDVALEAATHRLTLSSTGVAIASGTITTSQPLSLTQTWNAAGVTFKGIDVNVTDTASASGSLLMDLRVGGVSKFNISKVGKVNATEFWATASFSSGVTGSFYNQGFDIELNRDGLKLGVASYLSWYSNKTYNTRDLVLVRDAANTLAQRNGLNTQEFRLYGTYTDASNYERLKLKATGTAFQIGTEKLGASTSARPLEFQTDGTTRMTIGATGISLNIGVVSSSLTTFINSTGGNGVAFSSASPSGFYAENTAASSSTGGAFNALYSNDAVAMASGDRLGGFLFGGSSSASSLRNTAIVHAFASENWVDASSYGTRIEFGTTANGSTTRATRLIIGNSGAITLGANESNAAPALKPSSTIIQARLADDSAYTTIDAQHRLQGTAPASATAAGTAGDIRYDANYIYICTATNTWKRAAIATWP